MSMIVFKYMLKYNFLFFSETIENPSFNEVEEFLTEIEMLKSVGSHKNIVEFLGCCATRAPYMIVMEYVGRGNLVRTLNLWIKIVSTNSKLSSNI